MVYVLGLRHNLNTGPLYLGHVCCELLIQFSFYNGSKLNLIQDIATMRTISTQINRDGVSVI